MPRAESRAGAIPDTRGELRVTRRLCSCLRHVAIALVLARAGELANLPLDPDPLVDRRVIVAAAASVVEPDAHIAPHRSEPDRTPERAVAEPDAISGGELRLGARELGADRGGELRGESLVRVERQDVVVGSQGRGEPTLGPVSRPGVDHHARASLSCELDGAVGRSRVDDHDLVCDAAHRSEECRERLLLVSGDDDHAEPSHRKGRRIPRELP